MLAGSCEVRAKIESKPDVPMRDDFADHILSALIDPAVGKVESSMYFDWPIKAQEHRSARAILFAVGMAESGYKVNHQIHGPALGYWQMEPEIASDLIQWEFEKHKSLWNTLQLIKSPSSLYHALEFNPIFACAMARCFFLRIPEPIPEISLSAFGRYWKKYYNTKYGAGTVEEFVARVKPVWPDGWAL